MLKYTHACFALLSPQYPELKDEYQEAIKRTFNNNCIEKIQISFKTYLESQIHYGAMVHINNRNILDYNNAYNHMLGKSDNIIAYKKVLKFYYKDISKLIFSLDISELPDFSLVGNYTTPRCEGLKTVSVSRENIKTNIQRVLDGEYVIDQGIDYAKVANYIPISKTSLNHPTLIIEGALYRYLSVNNDTINVIWR